MAERVVPIDLGVRWEPNAPNAVLVLSDSGEACLGLEPHPDDEDRRRVVLRWSGCQAGSMSAPNDEARHTHPLYNAGLRSLLWAGEVAGSSTLRDINAALHRGPLHHYIVPLKEGVVEVLADTCEVLRLDASPSEAVLKALAADNA